MATVGRSGASLAAAMAAAIGLLMAACSLVPFVPGGSTTAPDDVGVDAVGMDPREPGAWWETFDDPTLNRIVESVIESNFDLASAVARVEQARARARIAVAARLPTVQASLTASGYDAPTNAGLGAQLEDLGLGPDTFAAFDLALPDRLDQTTYSAGADFAYEVDFWGRARSAVLSARAERRASEADYRAARIGVLAETVATYLEIVDLRRQRHLGEQTIAILRDWASLATERYDRGVGDIRDVYAIGRDRRDAEAALPGIDGRLTDAQGRLKVLMGSAEDAGLINAIQDLMPPAVAAPVPAGVPAHLLAQRPDVAAARQRLLAARLAVDARRAELLPSLSLSGSIGLQSANAGDWFDPDQWFGNLSSNLLAPVFQGGRLRGNVALAEARLDEATAAYGHAVVTAAAEVETALAALESSRQRAALLGSFAEEAYAEAQLQERRYEAGVGDYATFLAASRMDLGARAVHAGGQRDLAYARLALHRALGGAWAMTAESADVGPSSTTPTTGARDVARAAPLSDVEEH